MCAAVTMSGLYLMSRGYLNLAQTGAEIWGASSNLIEKNVGCEGHIAQTGHYWTSHPLNTSITHFEMKVKKCIAPAQ